MRCGPFDIVEPIASGGMGTIYRAQHRRDGTEAAIKVMRERARLPDRRRRFVREVQWLARLDHPSIATIYDFGIAREEQVDPGFLQPGAPWLAMELVDGTQSTEHFDRWDWPSLQRFLIGVLEALAHAHARKVIHRDLKPANIMVTGNGAGMRVKLVDFGIATTLDDRASSVHAPRQTVRGTPEYMSPEQVLDRLTWFGPWTDIYALGCLAWCAVCGRSPFRAGDNEQTMIAQVKESPPGFQPRYDVPTGLEAWLRRALEKHPQQRFRRAADAAFALRSLDADDIVTGSPRGGGGASEPWANTPTMTEITEPTRLLSNTRDSDETVRQSTASIHGLNEQWAQPEEPPASGLGSVVPPFSDDWRAGGEELVALPPSEAGLELFSLRELPMVGRFEERDQLWSMLGEVCETGRPRVLALRGAPGSGKSRLARWLAERAHETGAAIPLTASHARVPDAAHGLGPMLARYLRVRDMPWEQARGKLIERFRQLGIGDQTSVSHAYGFGDIFGIEPESPAQRDALGFDSAGERHRALLDVLRAISEERPLVLWFDDVHWADATLDFVNFMAERTDDAPSCLVVMTMRDSELQQRASESETLHHLLEQPCVSSLELEPLAHLELRALVESMLSFHPEVVDQIVERSEGHPLFANQLVDHWVERGALRLSDGVFELDPDADVHLPDSLESIWERRLEYVFDRLTSNPDRREELRHLLQIAAALGRHVDAREWQLAVSRAGVAGSQTLPSALADAGLTRATERGMRASHRLFWEYVAQSAREEGVWARWKLACAQVLEPRVESDRSGRTARRCAQYLLEAGELERALDPLHTASRRFRYMGHEAWSELVERRREIIEALGLARSDRRHVQNLVEEAVLASEDGRPDDEERLREEAETIARREGYDEELVRVLQDRALWDRRTGRIEEALELLTEAERLVDRQASPEVYARVVGNRATTLLQSARPAEARELLEDIVDHARSHGLVNIELRTRVIIGWTWMEQGQAEQAVARSEEALDNALAFGHRAAEGTIYVLLGDAYREMEQYAESRVWCERAIELFEAREKMTSVLIVRINMFYADLLRGDFSGADTRLEDLRAQIVELGSTARMRFIYAGEMVIAAEQEQPVRLRKALAALRDDLAQSEALMRDIPLMVERAASLAAEHNLGDVTREVTELARSLWARYGDDERAASLDSSGPRP
ncbi:MAG: serine/threonine-protein kinase PknK [Myxococcota bacterium]